MQTQNEDAKIQAEFSAYNEKHSTSFQYPEDATALYYEFEGGSVPREDLLGLPQLLAFWDRANQANEWMQENEVEPVCLTQEDDDNLPF